MKRQREAIKKLFEENPGRWIPVYELSKIALQYGTRLYELRRKPYFMHIEKGEDRVNGARHTRYRFLPRQEAQMTLDIPEKTTYTNWRG